MEYDIGYMEQQLSEKDEKIETAKKIIKDILNVCCSNCTNPHCVDCKHRKIVLNAENFLKE